MSLSDKARTEHGRQCCGGEVTLLLEPLAVVPSVAIFGVGHVGLELARILRRHDLELHLVDSRADQVAAERLAVPRRRPGDRARPPLAGARAGARPVPRGTHVLVMTHDHAEDFALCDAALRCAHLGSIGLIGSSAKWPRFRQGLAVEGHDDADDRPDPLADRRSRTSPARSPPPSPWASPPSWCGVRSADRVGGPAR